LSRTRRRKSGNPKGAFLLTGLTTDRNMHAKEHAQQRGRKNYWKGGEKEVSLKNRGRRED